MSQQRSQQRSQLRTFRAKTGRVIRRDEFQIRQMAYRISDLRTEWRTQDNHLLNGDGGRRSVGGGSMGSGRNRHGLFFSDVAGETGLKLWALDWELIERRVRES